MRNIVKKICFDKTGSIPPYVLGLIFCLMATVLIILEVGGLMERHDYALSVIQRSCNSAVEKNILDKYRSDDILLLDTNKAENDFCDYIAAFNTETGNKYQIVVTSAVAISDTEANVIANGAITVAPSMTVKGTMSVPSMFGNYAITVGFTAYASNYDIDNFVVPTN